MTLQPADLDRLEQLAREATPGPWHGTTIGNANQRDAAGAAYDAVMARRLPDCPDCEFSDLSWVRTEGDDWLNVALVGNGKDGPENAAYIAALDPAVVSELVAAARLGAAWQAAEAALPEGFGLSLTRWDDGHVTVWATHHHFDEHFDTVGRTAASGLTPAAALLALAEALRLR